MSIWHLNYDRHDPQMLARLNEMSRNTADEHLGIRITEIGEDYIRGTVPVDKRTVQPFGLLHGGISVVLAESLGSLAGNLCVDPETTVCVGLAVNANHLRGVRTGTVTGTARAVHVGRSTQVWEIMLRNDDGELTCITRLTLAAIPKSQVER